MKLKIEKVKWITEHLKKMNRRKIIFRDPVVERVVDKFVERSNVGFDKYGTTLNDERTMKMKGLVKYLNDIQEELMDAILYIQTAREELKDLSDDALVEKCKEDAPEMIDGIGDCVVVLTNLAELIGTPIEECIDKAYNEIKGRKGKMDNGTFKKDE